MKPYHLLILVLFICSCQRTGSKSSDSETKIRAKPTVIHRGREQWLQEAEKDYEIYGVYELSNDSIILLRRSIGIELSTDNGKTWKWMAKDIAEANDFTVDNMGVWWVLENWRGIHEASYCRLHKSIDKGNTWTTYNLDSLRFFPDNIFSKHHQPLKVVDISDNKVYQLKGSNPMHDWKFIKRLPLKGDLDDISVENYFVARQNNKLYVKRKNGKTDTLMTFTKAWDISKIEMLKGIIYVVGDGMTNNSYFAVIKNERLLKEFTFAGGDLDLFITPLGRIYLTSTEGAYSFKNDRIIPIFQ